MIKNDVEKVLVTKEQLAEKTKQLAAEITRDYKGKDVLLIGVLKGGFMFLADLIREIDLLVDVDFMMVSSYGSTTKTSGVVKIIKDIDIDISGKHIIIVEDLVDTGLTLNYLKGLLEDRATASVKICAILDKPSRRLVDLNADYCGFAIPDEFVVGYGLDYANKYRNIPDVCTLKQEIYK